MIQLSKREIDLNLQQDITLDPYESATFVLDFKRDITGATHKLLVNEFEWEYKPKYMWGSEISLERTVFDTSLESDGVIRHVISTDDLELMQNRRLTIRWITTLGSEEWIAYRTTITIQGNLNG